MKFPNTSIDYLDALLPQDLKTNEPSEIAEHLSNVCTYSEWANARIKELEAALAYRERQVWAVAKVLKD